MRLGNLLFSAAQFLFAVLVILLGGVFIGVQHIPHVRFLVVQFFLQPTSAFALTGYAILGGGGLLLLGFYWMHRGVYYRVSMGRKQAVVDLAVIRGDLEAYWKEVLPNHDLNLQVVLNKQQQIEMLIEMPPMSQEKQLFTLQQAEKELEALLKRRLGYHKEFVVSVLEK